MRIAFAQPYRVICLDQSGSCSSFHNKAMQIVESISEKDSKGMTTLVEYGHNDTGGYYDENDEWQDEGNDFWEYNKPRFRKTTEFKNLKDLKFNREKTSCENQSETIREVTEDIKEACKSYPISRVELMFITDGREDTESGDWNETNRQLQYALDNNWKVIFIGPLDDYNGNFGRDVILRTRGILTEDNFHTVV